MAEGIKYRGRAGRRPEGDRIVVLEDTTGEGKANKSTTFYQDKTVAAPLGVAVLEDKVIVSQAPNMTVFTDTNRDGKFDPAVDKQEVLLTGFGGHQHDHSLHSVTVGPDGFWYWNQGNTGGKFTDRSGKNFLIGSHYGTRDAAGKISDDGNVWVGGFSARMNPDGTQVRILGHNYRNSYEHIPTSFGGLFQNDNDDPPACRVGEIMEGGNAGFASADGMRGWPADRRPGQDVPTAHWRQEDPGTMPAGDIYGGGAPTGICFYENGALPDKWRGLLLSCDGGINSVLGYLPEPDGAGFKMARMYFITTNKEKEYSGSDFIGRPNNKLKTKFRPSDVTIGPDGAIYVADWFDPRVGGHATHDDPGTGAIYRIAPKGFKSVVPKFDLNTTAGQITALKSPAINVRASGFNRLKAQGQAALPAVVELLKDPNPYIAARAIWLLPHLGAQGLAKANELLSSKDATQRLVAYRALRRIDTPIVPMATKMVDDESPAVRREVALSLRGLPAADKVPLLVKIAQKFDGKDRAYLEAFGLGATGNEAIVYEAVAKAMGGSNPEDWKDNFAWIAWRLHSPQAVADFKARTRSTKLDEPQRKLMLAALAFVDSPAAAGAMVQLAADKEFPLRDLANWWLKNLKTHRWKGFEIDKMMETVGLYDPAQVKLTAVPMPPEEKGPAMPPLAELVKLKGDADRGATLSASCLTCHRIGQAGVEFGPNLTTYGKQQPFEVIVNGIAYPSSDISHGFEGTEIKTKDGLVITGMVIAEGDPILIKCMGGLIQTVPKSNIASQTKMTKSLMYTPQTLKLAPQDIADIAAFLQK